MSKELVINSDGQNTRIAIVEDGELAELFIETEEHERTLGNLFVGRIRRVMPSIQAAFVDIGQKQDAFLHFSDLTEGIADWLEYIQLEKPEIAKFARGHVQKQHGGRRRRPVSARRRKRLEDGAEDPEAELAEEQADGEEQDDGGQNRLVGRRGRGRRKAGQASRSHHGGRSSRRDGRDGDGGVPPETFLRRDQPILVKISKEPIAAKGSRVTTDVSLAGRFLVLVPMANYVAVSKKISSFKERRRLRALAKMLLPDGFGVIVRTVAEGQNAKALDTDLRLLREKWQEIESRLAERPRPPAPIHEDVNMVSSIMRDLFSEDFDRIVIDDQRTYRNIKGYVQAIAPEMGARVILHDKKAPVFRSVGIERSVSEAFESRVNLPSGGYLFIEQTEAMHVVDVNSGRAGRGLSQEDNSLKVNVEAATVIARQIRLRDLGGILVIDFIDMRSERSRRKVYEQIRKEFRNDRAVTKVLPMSDFGLMQITRQRLRPSITDTFSDMHEDDAFDTGSTPGDGQIVERDRVPRERPRDLDPDTVVTRITDWLEAFGAARWKGAVRLKVHPFTAAYLSRGWFSFALRCLFRYRIRLVLEESAGMDPARFRFFDETNGKEIRRPPRRGRKKTADRKADAPKAVAETAAAAEAAPESAESSEDDGGRRSRSSRSEGRGRRSESGSGGRSRRSSSDEGEGRGRRGRRSASTDGEGRSERSGRGRRSDSGRAEENADEGGRSRSEPSRARGRGRRSDSGRAEESAEERAETKPKRAASSRGRAKTTDVVDEANEASAESPKAPVKKRAPRKTAAAKAAEVSTDDAPSLFAEEQPVLAAVKAESAASPEKEESSEQPRRSAPQAEEAPVRPKTPTPQPFRLRYSSSHTSESQVTPPDQA